MFVGQLSHVNYQLGHNLAKTRFAPNCLYADARLTNL